MYNIIKNRIEKIKKLFSKTTVGYSKASIMYLRITEFFAEFTFKTVFKNRYGFRKFKGAVKGVPYIYSSTIKSSLADCSFEKGYVQFLRAPGITTTDLSTFEELR